MPKSINAEESKFFQSAVCAKSYDVTPSSNSWQNPPNRIIWIGSINMLHMYKLVTSLHTLTYMYYHGNTKLPQIFDILRQMYNFKSVLVHIMKFLIRKINNFAPLHSKSNEKKTRFHISRLRESYLCGLRQLVNLAFTAVILFTN